MKSKAVVFACLLLLASIVVSASAVSEGSQQQPEKAEGANTNTVEESKQHCYHGCCKRYGYRCVECCKSAAEAQAYANNNNNDDAQQEHEVEAAAYRWGGGGGHRGGRGGGGGHRGGRGGGGGGGK